MKEPRIIGGIVLREAFMESARRPAWTQRNLAGHRIRRHVTRNVGIGCNVVVDIPSCILSM
jgi:hypothetical protein